MSKKGLHYPIYQTWSIAYTQFTLEDIAA